MKMYLWSIVLAVMLAFSFTATAEPNIPGQIFTISVGDQATPPIILAESPYLVDRKTGKFLGNLNSNRYDPNSVANPVGRYGSPYRANSVNNPSGKYGSPYSPDSSNNPYLSGGPLIIHRE